MDIFDEIGKPRKFIEDACDMVCDFVLLKEMVVMHLVIGARFRMS